MVFARPALPARERTWGKIGHKVIANPRNRSKTLVFARPSLPARERTWAKRNRLHGYRKPFKTLGKTSICSRTPLSRPSGRTETRTWRGLKSMDNHWKHWYLQVPHTLPVGGRGQKKVGAMVYNGMLCIMGNHRKRFVAANRSPCYMELEIHFVRNIVLQLVS